MSYDVHYLSAEPGFVSDVEILGPGATPPASSLAEMMLSQEDGDMRQGGLHHLFLGLDQGIIIAGSLSDLRNLAKQITDVLPQMPTTMADTLAFLDEPQTPATPAGQ